MNRDISKGIYGQGWAFPPTFCIEGTEKTENGIEVKSGVTLCSGVNDVQQSLIILLSTQYYERIMRMEYGNDLMQHMFDNIGEGLFEKIRKSLTVSILNNEPRVVVDVITISSDRVTPSKLSIIINYHLFDNNVLHRLYGMLDIKENMTGVWR